MSQSKHWSIGAKHWWDDPNYKQAYWTEPDWADWEKHGRPDVPRESRLGSDDPMPLDGLPVPPPPGPQSSVTTLFPKPSRRDANARSRAVDRLIQKYVGR